MLNIAGIIPSFAQNTSFCVFFPASHTVVVQESKSVLRNPFETIRPGGAHQVSWDYVNLTSWSADQSVVQGGGRTQGVGGQSGRADQSVVQGAGYTQDVGGLA